MRVTKIITWLLVCAFLISGCAKNENADSAAEPEESVQEDYQEETEQEQSEEWDLSQEDEWMPEDQTIMINLSGIFYDNGCIKPLHPKCLSLIGGRISCIYHISVHLCKIVIHTGTGSHLFKRLILRHPFIFLAQIPFFTLLLFRFFLLCNQV